MAYANQIFKQIQNPTIILFNAMIKGYSLNGPFEESFRLFSSMKNRGIWPDEYTLAPLLKACSSLGVLQLGKCIHKEVVVVGFEGFSSTERERTDIYEKRKSRGDNVNKKRTRETPRTEHTQHIENERNTGENERTTRSRGDTNYREKKKQRAGKQRVEGIPVSPGGTPSQIFAQNSSTPAEQATSLGQWPGRAGWA
ncbi:hypothetical protein NC652_010223 [Populus alba x Populus x berolinensis]|nr:hypothetical protein NC652_010223 [Populus alba x Populus x berolinensis]